MLVKSRWSVFEDIPTETGTRVFLRNCEGTHLIDVTLLHEQTGEVLEYVRRQEWSTSELLNFLRHL